MIAVRTTSQKASKRNVSLFYILGNYFNLIKIFRALEDMIHQ